MMPTSTHPCRECGQTMHAVQWQTLYCSKACQDAATRKRRAGRTAPGEPTAGLGALFAVPFPPDWPDARCRGDLGFLDLPTWQQIDTCATCPVRRECYDYGLSINATGVVYGGTLMGQRQRQRRPPRTPRRT